VFVHVVILPAIPRPVGATRRIAGTSTSVDEQASDDDL
jgi:hypothetical protein